MKTVESYLREHAVLDHCGRMDGYFVSLSVAMIAVARALISEIKYEAPESQIGKTQKQQMAEMVWKLWKKVREGEVHQLRKLPWFCVTCRERSVYTIRWIEDAKMFKTICDNGCEATYT